MSGQKKNRKLKKQKRRIEVEKSKQKKQEQQKQQQIKQELAIISQVNSYDEANFYKDLPYTENLLDIIKERFEQQYGSQGINWAQYYDEEHLKEYEGWVHDVIDYTKEHVNFVSIQEYKQLDPQDRQEDYLRVYDVVEEGLKDYEGVKYKYYDDFMTRHELYESVANAYRNNIVPSISKIEEAELYKNLVYIAETTHGNKINREAYERRNDALGKIFKDKIEFMIFNAYNGMKNLSLDTTNIDWDFDKIKSAFWRMVDDLVASMHYSSDQAIEYLLMPDSDIFDNQPLVDVLVRNVMKPKYAEHEEKAKKDREEYRAGKKAKILAEMTMENSAAQTNKSFYENEDEMKEKDFFEYGTSEFMQHFNIINFDSKHGSRILANLRAALSKYDDPEDILFKWQRKILDPSNKRQINQLTSDDLKYITTMELTGHSWDYEPERNYSETVGGLKDDDII